MLGGAALTRRYVEEDCVKAYAAGRVAYARDAFDGLGLMDKIVTASSTPISPRSGRRTRAARSSPTRKLGRAADPRPLRPVDLDEIRLRRAELTRGVAGAAAALLGAAHDRAGAGEGGRALPQRAHALPIPVGLSQGRPIARRIQGMGQGRAAAGAAAHPRHRDPRGNPGAAGRLRLLAVRRRGQRRDPVRPRRRAAS